MMGIDNIDYLDDHPDFARENVTSKQTYLAKEGMFPDAPVLNDSDWQALRNYYVESATAEPLPQEGKPPLQWELSQFDIVQMDFVVFGFGMRQGNVAWFESQSDGSYKEHVLIDRAGAVQAQLCDFNGDEHLDITVLMADAREGSYILINNGANEFESTTVISISPRSLSSLISVQTGGRHLPSCAMTGKWNSVHFPVRT